MEVTWPATLPDHCCTGAICTGAVPLGAPLRDLILRVWSRTRREDWSLWCVSPAPWRCSPKSATRPCRASPTDITSPTSRFRCSRLRSSWTCTSCVSWSMSLLMRSSRSPMPDSRLSAWHVSAPSSSRIRSEEDCISRTAFHSFDCDWSATSASCANAVSFRTVCSLSDWIFSLMSWSAAALLRTAFVISRNTPPRDSRTSWISFCICCWIAAPCRLKSARSERLEAMAFRIMPTSACIWCCELCCRDFISLTHCANASTVTSRSGGWDWALATDDGWASVDAREAAPYAVRASDRVSMLGDAWPIPWRSSRRPWDAISFASALPSSRDRWEGGRL
mmetsp:Transcript_97107/g.275093  ORF Transcript_97107/g.275093 Transcript_97107/m.275093 type:complete len:336 (+) Transcript_97107:191-1198(+)